MSEKVHTRWKRIAAGLCGYCGERPPKSGKKGCARCLIERAAYDKAYRDQRVEQGICHACGKPNPGPYKQKCPVCYRKSYAPKFRSYTRGPYKKSLTA